MEISIIIALIVIAGTVWYINRDRKIDANNDGKIDLEDVKILAGNTAQDVKVAVKQAKTAAKTAAKKTAVKAKAAAKSATKKRVR